MVRISQYYGITGDVPFVDVELEQDNLLFIDPHAIRMSDAPQPFADQAVGQMDSFFQCIAAAVMSHDPFERARGQGLLQTFTEPAETRLGMSRGGFRGHGGAREIGRRIWTAMAEDLNALVQLGLLRHLETLPLFVTGVDRDVTSDITTRVIYGALAQYTQAMVEQYPEFTAAGHRLETVKRDVWDPDLRQWRETDLTLPIAAGGPLLLVPKSWAHPRLAMSAGRFYDTSVLTYAQLEQAVPLPNGKLARTPKNRLRKQQDLLRSRLTILRVTLRAHRNGEDLIAQFEAYVNSKLPPRAVA